MIQLHAWEGVAQGGLPVDPIECDSLRRRLRQRARHVDAYIHRSAVAQLIGRQSVVWSGRAAASRLDLPLDSTADDVVHVYVTASTLAELGDLKIVQLRNGSTAANATVHVVDEETWPLLPDGDAAPLVVSLDLAHDDDRAERLVRESVLRSVRRNHHHRSRR